MRTYRDIAIEKTENLHYQSNSKHSGQYSIADGILQWVDQYYYKFSRYTNVYL